MIRWLLNLPAALDHAAKALILLNRGERRDAEHAWFTSRTIFAYGRYPTDAEYKAYSDRQRDRW